MVKRAIIPPGFEEAANNASMSPAILSCGHLFLTGGGISALTRVTQG